MPLTGLPRRARVPALLGALAALACGWLAAQRFARISREGDPQPRPAAQQTPQPPAPPPEELVLTPGLERTKYLYPGASDTYRFHLAQSTYVEIALEQHGIDVVGRLTAPNGEVWLNVDSPSGTSGEELVIFEAPDPGEYNLTVASEEPVTKPGAYRLRVHTHRIATARDRARAAAEKIFDDAENARRRDTPQDLAHAARLATDALQRFRVLGEPVREALVMRGLGRAYQAEEFFGSARFYLDQARQALRRLGRPREAAGAAQELAGVAQSSGDAKGARVFYEEGLQLSRLASDRNLWATVSVELAYLLEKQGKVDEALRALGAAQQAFSENGNLGAAAAVELRLANILFMLDDPQSAAASFERSLKISQQVGDRAGVVLSLAGLGETMLAKGDSEGAQLRFARALDIAGQLDEEHKLRFLEQAAVARLWTSLGLFYQRTGQAALAAESWGRAIALHQVLGDRRSEGAIRRNLGVGALRQRDFAASEVQFNQALRLAREAGDHQTESDSLYGLARIDAHRGNILQAANRVQKALGILEQKRRSIESLHLRSSAFGTRQQAFGFYIDLLFQLYASTSEDSYLAKALEACERSKARSLLDSLQSRQTRLNRRETSALDQQAQNVRAELVSELHRLQGDTPYTIDQEGVGPTLSEIRRLLAELDRIDTQRQIEAYDDQPAQAVEPLSTRQLQASLESDSTALLEYCLADPRSFLFFVTPTKIRGLVLPSREILEPLARQLHEELSGSWDAVAASRSVGLARQLSSQLLGGLETELAGKRIAIVPDGDLNLIPFAALPLVQKSSELPRRWDAQTIEPYLGLEHELWEPPSGSAAFYLRERASSRPSAPRLLALIGDPVFERDDPRLHAVGKDARGGDTMQASVGDTVAARPDSAKRQSFARIEQSGEEIRSIARLASGHGLLRAEGLAANRQLLTRPRLSHYRILHFATHAFIDGEVPELSGLVLSQVDATGRPIYGVLRAYEIQAQDFPADLVVLSACNTARGKQVRGEGVESLGRSFLTAGASQVLVSLWKVEDGATKALMDRFYLGLLRESHSPSEALLLSQRAIASHPAWRSPYFWAGFVLLGQPTFKESRR